MIAPAVGRGPVIHLGLGRSRKVYRAIRFKSAAAGKITCAGYRHGLVGPAGLIAELLPLAASPEEFQAAVDDLVTLARRVALSVNCNRVRSAPVSERRGRDTLELNSRRNSRINCGIYCAGSGK